MLGNPAFEIADAVMRADFGASDIVAGQVLIAIAGCLANLRTGGAGLRGYLSGRQRTEPSRSDCGHGRHGANAAIAPVPAGSGRARRGASHEIPTGTAQKA